MHVEIRNSPSAFTAVAVAMIEEGSALIECWEGASFSFSSPSRQWWVTWLDLACTAGTTEFESPQPTRSVLRTVSNGDLRAEMALLEWKITP